MLSRPIARLLIAATAPLAADAAEAPVACEVALRDGAPGLQRREGISALEALGPQCLKRLLVACQQAAERQVLDGGSAATCSMGYEALLRSRFHGDFQALLAWWRDRAGDPDLDLD